MSVPLVSVLMTAYNRELYIAQAIESVLASDYSDFELIVVDDRSKDATLEIARSYERDARVRVHFNDTNLGDYPNRNRAASLAQGKYLKYLDSDDTIYPHGLGVMVQAMEKFPEAALALERPPLKGQPYPIEVAPEQVYQQHFNGGFLDCGPSGSIIRTNAFREVGGFSGLRYVGDTQMWLKLAARFPVLKLTRDLIWWRVHEGQEISLGDISLGYAEMDYSIAREALLAPECPLGAEEVQQVLRQLKRGQGRRLLRLIVQHRHPRSALGIMRRTNFSVRDLAHAFSF